MTYHEREQNATVGKSYKEMTTVINTTSIYNVSPYAYVGMQIVTDQQKAEAIIQSVKRVTGVDNPFKMSKIDPHKLCREVKYSDVRHAMRFLIHKHTRLSLKAIARMTGGADHSTVLNSIKKYQDLIDTDKRVKQQFYSIELLINN